MQYASQNLIPVTLELGGKSPNIFFDDVAGRQTTTSYDKALEGFTMFALNQGEVCTCPSARLVQADIYEEFLAMGAIRTRPSRQGDPLDTDDDDRRAGLQRPAREDPVATSTSASPRAPRWSPAVSARSSAAI